MRLFDRYLMREFLVPLGYCLAGFLVFWITFDLFGELGEFQENKMGAWQIVGYYWLKIPELIVTILPVVLLLALLYTLTNLSRHNELIALRAAGISLWRCCLGYILASLCFCGLIFYLSEYVVSPNKEKIARIRRNGGESPATAWKNNLHFRNAADRRMWSIASYNSRTAEMIDPHIEIILTNGSVRHIIATRGLWTNGIWAFSDVQILDYKAVGNILEYAPFRTNRMSFSDLNETPEQIDLHWRFAKVNALDAAKRPQFSLREIYYLRDHLEMKPSDRALLETQFHARLAEPWRCLIVVLLAISFGAPSGRRNVFAGVASSIFICFVFFVLTRFGMAFGTSGRLDPIVAAWAPNVVFALFGLWMTRRVR